MVWCTLLLCVFLLIASVAGHLEECGTNDPTPEQLRRGEAMMATYHNTRRVKRSRAAIIGGDEGLCKQCIEVDVAFHIMEDEQQMSNASTLWTDDGIDGEIMLLNNRFNETPFRFSLVNTTRTYNDTMSTTGKRSRVPWEINIQYLSIAQLLRVGGANTMNVIVNSGICPHQLGFVGDLALDQGMFPNDTFSATDFIGICENIIGPS